MSGHTGQPPQTEHPPALKRLVTWLGGITFILSLSTGLLKGVSELVGQLKNLPLPKVFVEGPIALWLAVSLVGFMLGSSLRRNGVLKPQ